MLKVTEASRATIGFRTSAPMSVRARLDAHAGSKAGSPSLRMRETVSIRRGAGVGHVQARHAPAIATAAIRADVPLDDPVETHASQVIGPVMHTARADYLVARKIAGTRC